MTKLRIYSVSIALAVISINIASAQNFDTGIPVLTDSTNQIVGPIVDITDDIVITVFVDDVPYPLQLTGLDLSSLSGIALVALGNNMLLYTTSDCSGTAYLLTTNAFIPNYFPVSDPNLTIWVVAQGATSQMRMMMSFADVGGGCSPTSDTVEVIEAAASETGLVAPYTLGRGPSILAASMAFGIPTLNSLAQKLLLLGMLAFGLIAFYRRRPQAR